MLVFKPGQKDAIEQTIAALEASGGCTLQAPCGAGKTVMGAEIIRDLNRRTIILVHKDFLAKQWEAELAKFAPLLRVGRIQRDRFDVGPEFDVVIVMIQSLLSREYEGAALDNFGLVVGDEVHRHSANEWSKAVTYFKAKLRLGLTATPDRTDGMTVVFKSHFGKIAHRMVAERLRARLQVRKMETSVADKDYMMWRGGQKKPNLPKLINALVLDHERNVRIVRDIRAAYDAGRQPLVLTHRREHAEDLKRWLTDGPQESAPHVTLLMGGMTELQQTEACIGEIVIATYQMAAEGLNVPRLDTVFLATPQAKVEQAIGRVMRVVDDKKQPVVVDYVDERIGICRGMYKARAKVYAALDLEERRAA